MPIEQMRRHFTLSTHKSELKKIMQQQLEKQSEQQQRQRREISTNCIQKCAANRKNV